MKKETINTFLKGMVKDLHPLSTPNDVLTDALNGTLITYNGNEGALLNDMGNVKIKNALLKSGYVPVGMKEHGGIIYVAAYNPETKKGQVGSFPSPKLLWEGDNWTVNNFVAIDNPTITPNFYSGNFIINEVTKHDIFCNQDGESRIFHPGDKFVIKLDLRLYEEDLREYVKSDWLDVQLGVVKSDGSIEIVRTWDKDNEDDIFTIGDNYNVNNVLNSSSCKVFDARSSGRLILIFNLHTFDSFSISKKYELIENNNNNTIRVTFTGEASRNGEKYYSNDSTSTKLRLATAENNCDLLTIVKELSAGTSNFVIYPNTEFGIVERMGKSIHIDFDKIRTNLDDFGEWRFFVTLDYVKIGWSYDFYNLDGSKEIDYIRMYFHKLENGYNRSSASHIDFQKEVYSGNFEEYIKLSDAGLRYKRIYIVEIVKKFKSEQIEEPITFKMLYLSELYNEYYNGFFKNNAIGIIDNNNDQLSLLYSPISPNPAHIKFTTKVENSLLESKAFIQGPGDEDFREGKSITKVTLNDYINEVDSLPQGVSTEVNSSQYVTKIENTYKSKVTVSGEITDINKYIIGIPNPLLVPSLLGNCTVSNASLTYQEDWNFNTPLDGIFEDIEYPESELIGNETSEVEGDKLIIDDIVFKDYRFILGLSSEERSSEIKTTGLMPLYSPKYTVDVKNALAPYWDYQEVRVISGNGEVGLYYNSRLSLDGETIVDGPNGGGGADDGGLRTCANLMERPLTNMFVGAHGKEAHFSFDGLRMNTSVKSGMGYPRSGEYDDGDEFDAGDDFMLACWKFTDGETRVVNLATSKYFPIKSSVTWPRLDVMLRCILSLIFTVRLVTKVVRYITTNPNFYRYHLGQSTLTIKLAINQNNVTDIMCSEDDPLHSSLNDIYKREWTSDNGRFTAGGKFYDDFVNLIPLVRLDVSSIAPISTQIEEFNIDTLLTNYLGTTFNPVDTADYNVLEIYTIDTSVNNSDACARGVLLADMDGAFDWKTTPKCIPLSENDGKLLIYRWNDPSKVVEFPNFDTHFTTRAKMENWASVRENSDNEVLAEIKNDETRCGLWTYQYNEAGPDINYYTLYSPSISLVNPPS